METHNQGMLGIVLALDMEKRGLDEVLSHSRRLPPKSTHQNVWQVGSIEVAIEVCGMGRERGEAAANSLINSGARWIISAGFAAALDIKAQVGDVVVADTVRFLGPDGLIIPCSNGISAAVPPSGRLGYNIWRADLITSDSVVLQAERKEEIYRATGAAALDMEAYGVAEACMRRGVPFAAIKGVSDDAQHDLPEEIAGLMEMRRWIDRIILIIGRPRIWKALWALRNNSRKAADNLGDVIGMILLRLI